MEIQVWLRAHSAGQRSSSRSIAEKDVSSKRCCDAVWYVLCERFPTKRTGGRLASADPELPLAASPKGFSARHRLKVDIQPASAAASAATPSTAWSSTRARKALRMARAAVPHAQRPECATRGREKADADDARSSPVLMMVC